MTEPNENIVLKPKQKAVCDRILSGEDETTAYFEVYKPDSRDVAAKNVSRLLLKNAEVSRYMEAQRLKLQRAIEEKTEVSVLKTVSELARVGYCDPANVFDETGKLKDVKDIEENTRKAIASIEVKEEYDREGNYTGSNTKIRFWNKNEALTTIARYLGMLIDRKDIRQEITFRELSSLAPDELKKIAEQAN